MSLAPQFRAKGELLASGTLTLYNQAAYHMARGRLVHLPVFLVQDGELGLLCRIGPSCVSVSSWRGWSSIRTS